MKARLTEPKKKHISNVACHLSVSYPSNQLANSGFNLRHCSLEYTEVKKTMYSDELLLKKTM